MQPTTPLPSPALVVTPGASPRLFEWFLPTSVQLAQIGFSQEKQGSAGVLDFVRHDKTTLTYVRLHSAVEPGRFALIRSYKRVFVGIATRDEFWLLLYRHGWQPTCVPLAVRYADFFKETSTAKPKAAGTGQLFATAA